MKIANYRKYWEQKEFHNSLAKTAVVCQGAEIKNSTMGDHSRLKPYTEFRNSILGDYSIVSSFSIVNAAQIGKFNSLGPGVFIGLWEHNQWVSTHSFYLSENCGGFVKGIQNYEEDSFKVTLGHDVWVGGGAVILKGVYVSDGAIIGAGSVVTKDVEPYAIVVGNPARLLRYRFKKEERDYLLGLKWWNFKRHDLQKMVDAKVWNSLEKVKEFCRKNKIKVDAQ